MLTTMKYIMVWCVLFNVASSQLNGDPAPGRSPGPPLSLPASTVAASSSASFTLSTLSPTTLQTLANQNSTLNKTNYSASAISHDKANNNNVKNAESSPNDILLSTNYYEDVNHFDSNDSDEIQVPQSNINKNRNSAQSVTNKKILNENVDKLGNEFVYKGPPSRPTILDETTISSSINLKPNAVKNYRRPCRNFSVNEYLVMQTFSQKIIKVEQHSSAAHIPIANFNIHHNIFDTKDGLVSNVIYSGMFFCKKKKNFRYVSILLASLLVTEFEV